MDESLFKSAPLPVSYRPKYEPRYTMMPCTETPKPWYSDMGPDFAATFLRQSTRPVNSRSLPEPTSAARRVRAKSRGYTMSSEPAPARPPDAMFTAKNLAKSVLGEYVGNSSLMESLNAKLNACVGKYRTMLAMFPRQNEPKPCSAETRVKQFTMPVYRATSPDMILGLASWVWMRSLTRSMGAVAVLAMEPEMPPMARSVTNACAENSFFAGAMNCAVICWV
mmetsp:Transcript_7643/g.32461  ORF Transcript_7643/g.32461 Transcript_7643/m.32461 type:complete len:223 (+) Transcript_7643:375-1043(+)